MATASSRCPELIRTSGVAAAALATSGVRPVDPAGYRSLNTTWRPSAGARAWTDSATSSEKLSSADSRAIVLGRGLSKR